MPESKGFALDRDVEGRIRVNPISVGNLVALLALLGVAVGSYTSIMSTVALMTERIETLREERIRIERRIDVGDKRDDVLNERLYDISRRLSVIENTTGRLDRKLDALVK